MAIVPVSATNIRLLSGVPFSNDYKNTRWFDDINSQTLYFSNKPRTYTADNHTFQRVENKTFVRVNESIDNLRSTNYMMFQNEQYNLKWFYAFVTRLEFRNTNVTYVHFELDVFQTWKFEMNFKPSFVTREHCKLWNSDGSPVINTIDEGLNYGSDYDVVATGRVMPNGAYKWLVIVSKTSLESGANTIESSIVGTPQPLHYYAIPYRDDDSVPNVFIEDKQISPLIGQPSQVLKAVYTAVSSVNDIVSVYVTDSIGVESSYDSATDLVTFPTNADNVDYVVISADGSTFGLLYFKHVQQFVPEYVDVFDKYSSFRTVKESKLLMYPYTVLIVTDFKGNQTEFKLEYINDDSVRIAFKGSLGTSNFTTVNINAYNRSINDGQAGLTSIESAMISTTPNDVPILNDMLSAFLQGNRNSLAVQKDSIEFNGIMNAIGGGIGAISAGGGANPLAFASAGANVIQGMGNSMIQMKGLNAKLQDINNKPPQLQKMGSNTAYNYGNGYNGIFLMKKQIKPEYQKKLEDFFNMFGYKVNEVKIPNFHTRRYWNFVQTSSCVITGDFNNEDLTELKAVFDNGITFWHTDDIGNYALENGVI